MRVVVGIDGSPESDAALAFAVEEAKLRGLPLRIVCSWEQHASGFVGEAFAATADGVVEAERHAEDVLRAALARFAPDAEALSVEGQPATVLCEQSQGAALLVVGTRGRGATKGLVLGSVSSKLAHHPPCAVAIVPVRIAP